MTSRWVFGVLATVAAVMMTGVGFAAFTSVDTVSGSVSAGSVNLQIEAFLGHGCTYTGTGAPGPGSIGFTGLNAAQTAVNLEISDIYFGEYCDAALQIQNTGEAPVNVTAGLLFAGLNGICNAGQTNCIDVVTLSGIAASGLVCVNGSPTPCGTAADISINFITLQPGQSYNDAILVGYAPGSDGSAPSTGAFELVYEGAEIP
ncbi:MAG: hypothetical protein WBG19_01585 [Thermoplasmata archaeon]